MHATTLIAAGTLLAMAIMAIVWVAARRMDNAGIVDIWWSFAFAPVALLYATLGGGSAPRRVLLAVIVCTWSLRLGTHLYKRVMSHHPAEDPRYAALRVQFPKHTWLMFLGFFELQAVLVGLLSIPLAIAAADPRPGLWPWEIAAVALWVIALVGEATADAQLAAFRARPENKGRVCEAGLWRFSRHPNYFFEWLVWVAYFVFALGAPWGIAGIISPLLMLFFLTRVTGIPPSEAHSLASRGDAYRDYQRRTSAFIPWFPKS